MAKTRYMGYFKSGTKTYRYFSSAKQAYYGLLGKGFNKRDELLELYMEVSKDKYNRIQILTEWLYSKVI